MSPEIIVLGSISAVVVVTLISVIFSKKPKKLKITNYQTKWKELQQRCKDKNEWTTLLLDADKLLDNALKKRKFKGKSMGERMVSAQRVFTNNDTLWFAHNLCKKILADPEIQLRESEVKDAMVGFRQALRDVKALKDPSQNIEQQSS